MTHPSELDDWAAELKAALDVEDLDVPIQLVLDLARDAAHSVARPAAPLTTFLVGYAAARRGGDPSATIAELTATASRLAASRGGAEA